MCKFHFLKFFDFFGYIPQFRIKGSERFTSKFGGFIFLLFIIVTIGYIIFQTYSFIITLNSVRSSMIIYLNTDNKYDFTPIDTYFGISLKDSNGNPLNLTKYPYFNIMFSIVNHSNTFKQETILKSEKCNISYFLYDYDLETLTNRDEIGKKLMNHYTCISDFNSNIQPSVFGISSYFSIKVDINEKYKNDPIFSNFMKNINPKVSFAYSNSKFNSMNKTSPYFSKIEETTIDLDIGIIKSSEFLYNPFETLDDDGLFFFNNFNYFISTKFSSQKNGTVFQLNRYGDSFKIIDSLTPENTLLNFRLKLSNIISQNHRSFKHIQDLTSVLGSFLPNIYLVFLAFANTVNQVKGKNVLMGSIYSNGIIHKLKEFHKDQTERKSIITRGPQNCIKFKDFEVKIELDSSLNQMKNLDNVKNIKLVEKKNSTWNLDDLFRKNQSFKFTFKDYVKSLFKDDRKSQLMKNAYSKFDEAIEIDAYLCLQQEFQFYKELFMNDHQRIIFETASKYKNFKNLFGGIKTETGETLLTIHQAISKLYEKNDENDKRLINYLENSLNLIK